MNTWPTLKEWWQFGGALALEVGILFIAAKLIAPRLRSASWRRALWQTVAIAMFIVVMGELNGVRGLMRPPRKPIATVQPQRTVVVTFKDAEMPAPLPSLDMSLPAQWVTPTQPAATSRWQERAVWPALAWLVGMLLVAARVLLAQFIALVFRLRCRRIDDADLKARAERIRHTLRVRRHVALVENQRAIAPFTFGTLRPIIVLPGRFLETFTPEQQDAALLHEMAHIAGFDSAWRCVSDLTGALLWWHPLVWLARRELAYASELAADESSLLLHDGPGRLAECLVACAKEMRRPALTTWLGMDGGGFRSALGRRVTRLLELSPHARLSRPVPWYVRLIAPIICTALLWIGMVAVMKPDAPSSDTWRTSILGNAFAAPAEKPAPTVLSEATKLEVAKLIQDAKLFYETGRCDAARTNLQSALQIDPKNPAALYYLDLVNLVQLGAVQTRLRDRTNSLDSARQAIYDKLRQISLAEWGPIDNRPLSEVIRDLNDAIIRRDATGKGISFFISPNAGSAGGGGRTGPALDPAGLPILAAGGGTADLNGVSIRLGTKLKDMTIEEILNILMVVAETKMKYSVEDFGIMISPKGDEPTPLHTRWFRLDPNTFQKVLQSVQPDASTNRLARDPGSPREGAQEGGGSTLKSRRQIGDGIKFLTEVGPASSHVIPLAQQFFKSAGADLTTPGKALFYNDRIGALMVRATLEELDTIEKALQMLNMNPPQLEIRIKVLEVEVRPEEFAKLPLDYIGRDGVVTNLAASTRRMAKDLTVEQLRAAKPQPATLTGILTDEQFRNVVKGLEQNGGTDLLSAPSVITESGRQAQIKVVDVKYIVTDLDFSDDKAPGKPGAGTDKTNTVTVEAQKTDGARTGQPIVEPFELGPVIDVIPYVNADGQTIQMTVLPSLKEFLGYDEDPLKRKEDIDATGGPFANQHMTTPLPKFRLRSVATSAVMQDGQTLVISAGTARVMVKERHANSTITTNYVDKDLFFFVTPRLLDAAGNPLHSEETLRDLHKGVPNQKGAGESNTANPSGAFPGPRQ